MAACSRCWLVARQLGGGLPARVRQSQGRDDDDDAALSTHAKARAGFLDAGWDGVDVLNLGGSSDAVAEACRYAELLELATQQNLLPVAATASGETIPVFDMMVIGVGDDPASVGRRRVDGVGPVNFRAGRRRRRPRRIALPEPRRVHGRLLVVPARRDEGPGLHLSVAPGDEGS